MNTRSFRAVLLTALASLALYACGNSASDASSGLTQAQVQAMIAAAVAPLQTQVNTLQAQVSAMPAAGAAPAVFIRAPNAPAVKVAAQLRTTSVKATTTTTTCSGLGTLTGRPQTSDPISTEDLSGVSCMNYYFTVSGAATSADNAIVQPLLASIAVFYDAPNCTGNLYVARDNNFMWDGVPSGVSSGAVANGAVFRVYQNGANDPSNAATYFMLKAGTVPASVNVQSLLVNGQCNAFSSALSVYAVVPNDQTVSGIPSAPIPGPVTIG